MELGGAAVVVTGASAGIGRATALSLAEHGAAVVVVARDREAVHEVARLTGGTPVVTDVTAPGASQRIVEATVAEYGRVDGIVANAGLGYVGSFADMPSSRIGQLLDVNLRAPMELVRAALPLMVERDHGSLVFLSSIAGAVPVSGEAAYCTTKTALEAFADALRGELRSTSVTVSTVRPGVVRTAFLATRQVPYDRRWPRPVAPERVARAVVDVLQTGAEFRTEPRWLDVAAWLRESSPWLYRSLSRRFS